MLQRVRGIDHHIEDELDAIKASAEETERELKVPQNVSSCNLN